MAENIFIPNRWANGPRETPLKIGFQCLVRHQRLQLRNLETELTLLTVLRRSLAVVHRLQAITPLVQQPLMYAKLFGQSQNVVAAFQPLHRHLCGMPWGTVPLVSLPLAVPFPAICSGGANGAASTENTEWAGFKATPTA